MNIFVTSDLHFGHRKILEYEAKCRPFSSVEEMDEKLIENWNSVIKPNDECYILGDLSFAKLDKTIELVNRLNGKKCLVTGNHDNKLIHKKEFVDLFEGRVFDLLEVKINKKHYIMCHYPMMTWNKCFYGSINLFGHVHSKWKGNNKQLNVGVDCHNLTPLNIEEIDIILQTLPNKNITF